MGKFRITITGRSEEEVKRRVADSLKVHPEYRVIVEPMRAKRAKFYQTAPKWVAVVGT